MVEEELKEKERTRDVGNSHFGCATPSRIFMSTLFFLAPCRDALSAVRTLSECGRHLAGGGAET